MPPVAAPWALLGRALRALFHVSREPRTVSLQSHIALLQRSAKSPERLAH